MIIVWGLNADALFANIAFRRATLIEYQDPVQGLQDYEQALVHESFGSQEIREQLAKDAILFASSDVDSGIKQQFFTFSKEQMQDELKDAQLNARGNFYLAVLCNVYGDYTCANTALQIAHEQAPKQQSILISLAENTVHLNDASSTLAYAKEAFDLYPDFTEARIIYARLAIVMGNDMLADELLNPLVPDGSAADPRIIDSYVTMNRPEKIMTIMTPYVRVHPDKEWGYVMLAAAYYWSGDETSAIIILQTLARRIPSTTDSVNELIQDMQGTSDVRPAVINTMLKMVSSTIQ
jgi:predicted Zn-dependent protease